MCHQIAFRKQLPEYLCRGLVAKDPWGVNPSKVILEGDQGNSKPKIFAESRVWH